MSSMPWKKFVDTPRFWGNPGKPDEKEIGYFDFLYIAQKTHIPNIYKIGITGGERKLGKNQIFIWSWQLPRPRLVEKMVIDQLKLFSSGWIKDKHRKEKNLPRFGKEPKDKYEYKTETFKDIDIFTLIHLVRLNVLAMYAHVGLVKNTEELKQLFLRLKNTPFNEIKSFDYSLKSSDDYFVSNIVDLTDDVEIIDDDTDTDWNNISQSDVIGRKKEGNVISYLFAERGEESTENKFKWINSNDRLFGRGIYKIKEYMKNQNVLYNGTVYNVLDGVIASDRTQEIRWKLKNVYMEEVVEKVSEKRIKLLTVDRSIDISNEYTNLGIDLAIFQMYTVSELYKLPLKLPVKVLKRENDLYKVQFKKDIYYVSPEKINDSLIKNFEDILRIKEEEGNESNFSNISSIKNESSSSTGDTGDGDDERSDDGGETEEDDEGLLSFSENMNISERSSEEIIGPISVYEQTFVEVIYRNQDTSGDNLSYQGVIIRSNGDAGFDIVWEPTVQSTEEEKRQGWQLQKDVKLLEQDYNNFWFLMKEEDATDDIKKAFVKFLNDQELDSEYSSGL